MDVTIKAVLAGLCLAVPIAGCATRAQAPLPQEQILTGQQLSQADANFVTESYRIVEMDNQEGQLAATQSNNPQIRALAAEIVSKANQLYPPLQDAIQKNGITPPRELPADLRGRLDRTRVLRGAAFDRSYLADQVDTHQRAIAVFEAEQARTQDPTLRALVVRALPVVQEDLGKLQALQPR
jgi:putative membrane protein